MCVQMPTVSLTARVEHDNIVLVLIELFFLHPVLSADETTHAFVGEEVRIGRGLSAEGERGQYGL